ncbi:transposase, IS605 OrfB family, central region [Allopseudospirillum japonicum]|uniref:Transposase, IS605 OrfB family, central region n=1 Tax=Allopseudospirillum japonicum TaxID=64971 RepID=A0A1H6QUK7_9GAMM|nr:RNA-guided endonuclease TnpB family protein [Allopseudospirillum japonicum]SEI47478.1 transposase, IS605 OrfB family, central region [Allopseudospirillum japonicum]
MIKATKVRIYPTPEQAELLKRQFGAVRFAYNKALHIISSQYKRHGTKLNAKRDMKPLLAVAKKSRKYPWLKDFDSIALQQACINLDKAFQNFFDPKCPARYPKFKRKHGKQSSYHCMSVSARENWIKVPKMEPIKARLQLAKAHERLKNARADFQHKLSRTIVDENQAVIVETLKVKNLLKNRKLSKHTADASWSALIQKLEYKAKAQGKYLVKIDPWFASSKTCSCCGHRVDTLPLSVRKWTCPVCTVALDRDVNAAINIRQQGMIKLRAEGLSVPANGGLRQSGHAPVAA